MNPPETTNELRACEASTGTAAPYFVDVVGADRLRLLPDCVPGNGKIASLDSISGGCSHTNFDPTVIDLKRICPVRPGLVLAGRHGREGRHCAAHRDESRLL